MKRIRIITAGMSLLMAAALCGCNSNVNLPAPQQTAAESTTAAADEAETAAETAADTPASAPQASAADTAVQETEAEEKVMESTFPPAPDAAEDETLPALEETLPETYAPGDNNGVYAWFRRGVYAAGEETWYVFYDEYSGKVVRSDGMGTPFSCEQTRGYINFHMGSDDNSEIVYISVDDSLNPVGTWGDGSTVTFVDIDCDPDSFDPTA